MQEGIVRVGFVIGIALTLIGCGEPCGPDSVTVITLPPDVVVQPGECAHLVEPELVAIKEERQMLRARFLKASQDAEFMAGVRSQTSGPFALKPMPLVLRDPEGRVLMERKADQSEDRAHREADPITRTALLKHAVAENVEAVRYLRGEAEHWGVP